jgi:hypothetical protein
MGVPLDVSKEAIRVHNYHCKRIVGLVRLGIIYGPRMGAWYLDYGLAPGVDVARTSSGAARPLISAHPAGKPPHTYVQWHCTKGQYRFVMQTASVNVAPA